MIRINQLKMPLGHDRAGLLEKAARVLRVPSGEIEKLTIVKQSVDARKKPDILSCLFLWLCLNCHAFCIIAQIGNYFFTGFNPVCDFYIIF